jgi:adenylosuccinate synthase
MRNIIIVGAQWGDEGKGKIVDLLTPHFDIVARYQGGHNAGHTVVVGDRRFILRLIPSGILHSGKSCVIGNGVVVDSDALQAEIEELRAIGIEVKDRFWISNRAHLILPYHRAIEIASEEARGSDRVGTTQRGIGPAYEDKIGRRGLRAADLFDAEEFRRKAIVNLADARKQLKAHERAMEDVEAACVSYFRNAANLIPYVKDTSHYLNAAVKAGKNILLEGAQGTMLDIDHGTYPFVTSSNSTAGGATTGTGLSPGCITGVLGIAKAYTTRVGGGPFPTELTDNLGEHLRQRGKEYGAVTGRPRRTGWFDAMVVRYAVMVNGVSAIALTKLDVLDEMAEIKICTGYRLRGEEIKEMPALVSRLAEVEPIYQTAPGWQQDTSRVKDYHQLPARARDYIKRLEDLVESPIGLISTGPERDETILLPNPLMQGWLTK